MKTLTKEYKGYVGRYSNTNGYGYYGKIEGIKDLITFGGDTIEETQYEFKAAVDDYIELRKEANKTN